METNTRREWIAIAVLVCSFLSIIAIAIVYGVGSKDVEGLFNSLLPLISTWVGTVLVFYFGKENFEAATKQYTQIINKLSPDLLDDIQAKQVMIDKYTMVYLDITDDKIINFSSKNLSDFLGSIKKSRLPILEGNTVKYVIHKSTFDAELAASPESETNKNFEKFKVAHPEIGQFGVVKEDDTIESARNMMKKNNYKDIFVLDADKNMMGWLTDSSIIRYMDVQ